MPKTARVLRKDIEIISARTKFEKQFPRDYQEWKIRAFLECTDKLEMQAVTNLIALGDNVFEIQAAHKLYQEFQSAFIKTIKFRSAPSPGELTKQIKLVLEQFNHICHSPKNLTVRLHRIENENEETKTNATKKLEPIKHNNLKGFDANSQGSYTGTGDHSANLLSKMKAQQQEKEKEKRQTNNRVGNNQRTDSMKSKQSAASNQSRKSSTKQITGSSPAVMKAQAKQIAKQQKRVEEYSPNSRSIKA